MKPKDPSRQLAVALRYNADKEKSPRVIAKGTGYVASRILEMAKANNIPVRDDPDLAASLMQLELDDIIPAELYPAVAEVLAFIYKANQKKK